MPVFGAVLRPRLQFFAGRYVRNNYKNMNRELIIIVVGLFTNLRGNQRWRVGSLPDGQCEQLGIQLEFVLQKKAR